MQKKPRGLTFYLILAIIIISILILSNQPNDAEKISYTQFINYLETDQIRTLVAKSNNTATMVLTTDEKYSVTIPNIYRLDEIVYEKIQANDLDLEYEMVSDNSIWINLGFTFLLLILIAGFYFFMIRQAQGGGSKLNSFGRSKARLMNPNKKKVTFQNVAGAEEEKEELQEVVDFLKDPRKYMELGARIPKGILLVGPPGTGKTLLAKAVAGEAEVPFFSISGSDFVEMFVGVGASRVRDMFDQAKRQSPCIVFIDEIDAVGRRRGAGLGGGHDEREQTLNQILVEMDGFGANEGVIIIAATNRPDILDPALLRPGRFDRKITVNRPDIKGREDILKVHSKGKPLGKDVDLETVSKRTFGFTGADLENLLNEAALLAARRGKKVIHMEEIEEASMKVVYGLEKKSQKRTAEDNKLTAYHEAGHAIASHVLPGTDPIHEVSIIPIGSAGGYTYQLPQKDRTYISKRDMENDIIVLLGGRVAEKLTLEDISTGASHDIKTATNTARNMVTKYGMSDNLGPIQYGSEDDEVFIGRDYGHVRNYSEKVAAQIDTEIRTIVDTAYTECERILTDNMEALLRVGDALIVLEKIDGQEFKLLFEGSTADDIKQRRADKKKLQKEESQNREEELKKQCEEEKKLE